MRRQITKQLEPSWGFSLVEMAVVIAIMGILMTFGIKLATSYQNKGAFTATADRQKQIKDTLTAYLGQHGRLPCPADPDAMTGLENPGGAHCINKRGLVPFATLGLPRSAVIDGWDRFFTYSVWDNQNSALCTAAPAYIPPITPIAPIHNWASQEPFPPLPSVAYTHTFHDGSDGCIKIEEKNSAGATEQIRQAVAALVSHGPNGFGGYNSKAERVSAQDITEEEEINIIDPDIESPELFHSRPIDINGFDDIVMGITANDLLIPLKKSGAVVSIRELERQYLYTLFSVNPSNCELTVPENEKNSTDIIFTNTEDSPLTHPVNLQVEIKVKASLKSPPYSTGTNIIISKNQYCPPYSPPEETP